ncbi:hypothetical protein MRX96_009532 [Rhipicephalus microplus]
MQRRFNNISHRASAAIAAVSASELTEPRKVNASDKTSGGGVQQTDDFWTGYFGMQTTKADDAPTLIRGYITSSETGDGDRLASIFGKPWRKKKRDDGAVYQPMRHVKLVVERRWIRFDF